MKVTSRYLGFVLACIISAQPLSLHGMETPAQQQPMVWFKKPAIKTSIAILGALATVATILLLANTSKKRSSAESDISYDDHLVINFAKNSSSTNSDPHYFEPYETKEHKDTL